LESFPLATFPVECRPFPATNSPGPYRIVFESVWRKCLLTQRTFLLQPRSPHCESFTIFAFHKSSPILSEVLTYRLFPPLRADDPIFFHDSPWPWSVFQSLAWISSQPQARDMFFPPSFSERCVLKKITCPPNLPTVDCRFRPAEGDSRTPCLRLSEPVVRHYQMKSKVRAADGSPLPLFSFPPPPLDRCHTPSKIPPICTPPGAQKGSMKVVEQSFLSFQSDAF